MDSHRLTLHAFWVIFFVLFMHVMVVEDWHAAMRRFGDTLALKCLCMYRLSTNAKLLGLIPSKCSVLALILSNCFSFSSFFSPLYHWTRLFSVDCIAYALYMWWLYQANVLSEDLHAHVQLYTAYSVLTHIHVQCIVYICKLRTATYLTAFCRLSPSPGQLVLAERRPIQWVTA